MGEPMARHLLDRFGQLTVWNRSPAKCVPLAEAGARIAASAAELFAASRVVFLMLTDGRAMDAVLERGTERFAAHVAGRTVVNTATVSPHYSKALEADIRAAGGAYVEAPVSGSRKPAEQGQLVAMLAGEPSAVAAVEPLLAAMCRATVPCGAVPRALTMKFAVNIFLIASITGLAEAAHFAQAEGLDLKAWAGIVNASQMASDISRGKVDKLLADNLDAQAAITNVLETTRLIAETAQADGVHAPLMDASLALYRRAEALGLGGADMISVVRAFAGD
ncbi:MAG: 2-hydroxy-3-oxopropionate reductase [Lysobacterales bacterium 14-68-21]|jgi:3-hydroxyisobutyrate dehydrogenase|nr:MAG: 2-hydroxy-3-oxopropionate reductase [Xanthomonadales bacterium 15-68-25]OZB66577.1 MAG: 2-hydroxy-3-oxopropionate reductase [Xanthomonadales bacterium 14-68-21]